MRAFLYSVACVLAGFAISALASVVGSAPIETPANGLDPVPVLLVGLVAVAAGWRFRLR